jgi:hypothetical protein
VRADVQHARRRLQAADHESQPDRALVVSRADLRAGTFVRRETEERGEEREREQESQARVPSAR